MKRTENFLCKCGCGKGEGMISPELLSSLQKFQDFINLPIVINSGFRCPEYNKRIDGAENSLHLTGEAVDISICTTLDNGRSQYWLSGPEILKLLHKSGVYFGGIGVGGTYLHLDIRKTPDFWFYGDVLKWPDSSVYYKKSDTGHLEF
jgi:hypothetical protein